MLEKIQKIIKKDTMPPKDTGDSGSDFHDVDDPKDVHDYDDYLNK